jgi:hypothetical protein
LALALGYPVAELKRRMPSAEFTQWVAYYGLDPFGREREDMQAAIVAKTVADCATGKNNELDAFLIEYGKDKEKKTSKPQSVISMQQNLMCAFKAAGCEIIDKREPQG